MLTLKEIEKSLGLSAEWIKKMGKIGVFDFIQNDPGTPGVPRTLNDQEMYTVFRFASYRQAGYPLAKLKELVKKERRLREIFLKYKSKKTVNALRNTPSVDYSVFNLIGTCQDPDGQLANIYPDELVQISKKDLAEINEIIGWVANEAKEIEKLIKREKKRLKMVQDMLTATEQQLEAGQTRLNPVQKIFNELEE